MGTATLISAPGGNCHTWFNQPKGFVDSVTGKLFFGGLTSSGVNASGLPVIFEIDPATGVVRGTGISDGAGVEAFDDHDDVAVLQLADRTILGGYSAHGANNAACRRTASANDLSLWNAIANPSTTFARAYCHLHQFPTSGKVWWMYRRQDLTNSPSYYDVSGDSGATWSQAGPIVDSSPNAGPYFHVRPNPSNLDELHFVSLNGGPSLTSNMFHFYCQVDNLGVPTWKSSNGTTITGTVPPAGALTPSLFTGTYTDSLVWNGTSQGGGAWNWDLAFWSGAPVIAFTKHITSTSPVQIEYWLARWTGSAWTVEKIANAYTASNDANLYAAQPSYAGGIALDPDTADHVYLSIAQGGGVWSIEEWSKSGSWAKVQTITGSGAVDARPRCVKGGNGRVFFWGGSYTTYNSATTGLYTYPSLSKTTNKIASPVFDARVPIGEKALFYINSSGSGAYADLRGVFNGSVNGSLTYASDAIGGNLSGFTIANYGILGTDGEGTAANLADLFAGANSGSNYPKWMAFAGTSGDQGTTPGWAICLGDSGGTNPLFGMGVCLSLGNQIFGYSRGDSGGANNLAISTTTPTTPVQNYKDGNLHGYVYVLWSATKAWLCMDGYMIGASAAATLGTCAHLRQATLGVRRSGGSVSNPSAWGGVAGGKIYAVGFGWGGAPDPVTLSYQLQQAQFQAFAAAAQAASGGACILLGM